MYSSCIKSRKRTPIYCHLQQAIHLQKDIWSIPGHYGPISSLLSLRALVCDTLLRITATSALVASFYCLNIQMYLVMRSGNDRGSFAPLQKVNIKGDDPYRHDWDCPYYVASMTNALADLVILTPELMVNGCLEEIQNAMTSLMPEYYQANQIIKERMTFDL